MSDQTRPSFSPQRADGHLIAIRKVAKTYQSAAGTFAALRGVNLLVDKGEFVAVIGKSGSGKSTLINMITGIDRPTSGEVVVTGTPVHTLTEGQLATWRGRTLGIIFQFFQLLPTLTLLENVMLPMDFAGLYTPAERRRRALTLLEQVELGDQAHKLPSAVSGGQQQRAAIARALANDPPILVADEPTGNLDSKTADSVFALFEQLVHAGKTILMVTHDNDLARRVSRTIILSDGEIIEEFLVRAFPSLSEEELVRATGELVTQSFAPGAIIIRQGEPTDKFYIITKGRIEVLIQRDRGEQVAVTTMNRGQYFGEIELLHGGRALATIRASLQDGVEVAVLDRQTFQRLISEAEAARIAIDRVAGEREAENIAARQAQHGDA